MVTTTNVKDNPSIPLAAQYAYLPDQLVYDHKNTVTNTVTIADSAVLKRGTVVGQISQAVAGGFVGTPVAASGNTGNGVISAISFGEEARRGNYIVHFLTATTFVVMDPDGQTLGLVSAGNYGPKTNISEIAFTFTAGGAAMIANDEIVIVAVPSTTNHWRASKASLTDGSQVPRGILCDDCDPTSGPVTAGVYVFGEFNADAVIFDASWTKAELVNLMPPGIFLKSPVSAADPT